MAEATILAGVTLVASLLFAGSVAGGCSAEGPARLRIAAGGEDFIEDRIPAAAVVDGWEIELSRCERST